MTEVPAEMACTLMVHKPFMRAPSKSHQGNLMSPDALISVPIVG